jgi:energy-coupling factor transporter ATP-binding protein EcfA2
MPNALTAGLQQIDEVAAEGDLDAPRPSDIDLETDSVGEPVRLPDGKLIYPPRLHGAPVHELACQLLDMQSPERSRFLRLVGPPGTGKSQLARVIAHELWARRGKPVEARHGQPFYGFVEMQPGPSSDEFFFRYDYVPAQTGDDVRLVDSVFVEAMRHGWVVMIDEANTARDVALLSINATLDGRLTLHLPATGETVRAQPGFAVLLAYNPGLVGATDIPDGWRSRFPATLEVTTNWPALVKLGAPVSLVRAARALDARRFADDGLVWTPQFRDIEALADMMGRVGDRPAIALFMSNIAEQVTAGTIQPAEASAVARMLDEAGYAALKVPATSRIANLDGYPRAVTT